MESERRWFIEAIRQNLDDDAPRLIYADWLEERGENERAEFIRVQCELARIAGCSCDTVRGLPKYGWCLECSLKDRERELLLAMPNEQHTMNRPSSGTWTWIWHRGFIDSITCTAADWLHHGDAILAEHPVREVRLTTWPGRGDLRDVYDGMSGIECKDGTMRYGRWPGVTFHLPEPQRHSFYPVELLE